MKNRGEMQSLIDLLNQMTGEAKKRLAETLAAQAAAAETDAPILKTEAPPSLAPVTAKARKQRKSFVRGVFEKVPGSGAWWIRFVDSDGRLRREKAGTKSAAIALYRKRKNKALEGQKLPETLRRRIVPFSELCDDAAAYIRKNYAQPQHDLGRLENIKGWFGSRGADSIDSAELEAALELAKGNGNWSGSTFNHHHTLLSLTYRLGIRNKKVNKNPASGVQREPENNSRVRYLVADEETRLRETIQSNPAWRDHQPELTLALNTGLRRSSMYDHLVWENVDLAARVAAVPRTKKGRSDEVEFIYIPLNADAMRALMIFRSRGDGTGRVVRNAAGEPLNYPTHWFVPAVRAAKIRDYKWHDNRHTYASRLRQTGTPLGNIAELLGHKGLAMTRRYAHLSISNLHEAVARIASPTDTTVSTGAESRKRREVAYVE
jgi:integrase